MSLKLTADSFLGLVKQSGLIEPDRLRRVRDLWRDEGVTAENPRSVAERLVEQGLLTRWQADKLLQGKHRGFFLSKYRLLSLLGTGGMSKVYLAEHVLMRRRCALKVLPSKRVEDT
ncbi:MAG: serine/threonine protein kinase, partial [Planctomycetaceae bacterium]